VLAALNGLAGFAAPVPQIPPDSTQYDDNTSEGLPYPFFDDYGYPVTSPNYNNPLYLRNPSTITTEVEYDYDNNQYLIKRKIGNLDYRTPVPMSYQEYREYDMKQSLNTYWKERAMASGEARRGGLIPQIHLGGETFDRIFGSNTIDIRPQGSAELIFGVIGNRRDDPALNVRQRKTVNFDFDEKIQMNVVAKIGDKIEFNTNYNTEATFDFENKLKLRYEGKEDEILQLIEAGDVTLPLNSTLITGSQSLFGLKTQLRFGRATVTAVYSEQKAQTTSVTVQGGAQTTPYSIKADEYEENRHFLMAKFFRDHYEEGLERLPVINSNINITKLEVWITNIGPAVEENRNIVAFSDLGEADPYNDNISPVPREGPYPSNYTNNLLAQLDSTAIRDINTVSDYLNSHPDGFISGVDYEKVESARKLKQNEYAFNSKLGFISLNTTLNPDQVLAVAFQYTVIGIDSVFQVGELSDQGISPPGCLVVKLLKSTAVNTRIPLWDLMMKNVYSIGAYQVNSQDFILNILYSGNENSVPTGYLTEGPPNVQGVPLIQVLNLDNLDPLLNPPHDGIFDFIDNAASKGGTIQASNGRIYFPVLEPFGSYLREQFGSETELADKYAYDSLYQLTKYNAQQYPEKNKFLIEGMYKSSSGSEISLNALNVPQGSVRVTAGGIPLTENVDYTVDYTLGRVRIINESIMNSGTPINISLESNTMFNIQTQRLVGAHMDYVVNKDLSLGATILNLRERPLTQKTNYGDDPISNTIWGFDMNYEKEWPFLTKMVDFLPFISTKAPSRVTFEGEFAHFIPGHSNAIGKSGTSYIDDFEGSKSTIDMKNYITWFLATTPQDPVHFPEGLINNDIRYGFNRAKLAWYIIDPLFYQKSGNLKPPNITNDELSNNYVRYIPEKEVFPNVDPPNGQPVNLAVFNLAYYPSERGPYNFDVEPSTVSAGINDDGTLIDPASRWGGIMRRIETTDFEATNVEYIEFWMMDPFADDSPNQGKGGKLIFHLGDISEDLLKDSRKSYENGLPISEVVENVDTTNWGRVPALQALVNSFDNNPESRPFQDVGYDGLTTADEQDFFENSYLNRIINYFGGTNNKAFEDAFNDPSADNYHYFRGADFDDEPAYSSILERYKQFNGPDGNSPSDEQNPEAYPTSATQLPNVEDINNDNTLNESERYYEYVVEIDTASMEIGKNYITDKRVVTNIPLENGKKGEITWYQFKVPVTSPERVVGNIQDFQSIRFMRMMLADFEQEVVLRFATLELVRGEWRRYKYNLLYPGEYVPDDVQNQTSFDISTVSYEENGDRSPVPYVIPPGIEREINLGTTNLQQLNEQAMVLDICNLLDGDARAAYKTTAFDIRQYKRLKMFIHAEDADPEQTMRDGDITIFIRIGADFTDNYYEYEIPLVLTPWFTRDPELIWPETNNLDLELEKLVEAKQRRNDAIENGQLISTSQPYAVFDGDRKITVIGTPSLSDVKAMMIGIRNPKKTTLLDDDDGESKCAEIWINELRLTDFDDKSGWAATGRLSANLADLGNVVIGGLHSTAGFGSIEKKVNERQKENTSQIDIATNIDVGRFFPEEAGIRIPFHFDYSQVTSNPQYNPLDPDVLYKDVIQDLDQVEKDSLKLRSQTMTERKNLNLVNVRKERVGMGGKMYPWNIENFNFTYTFQEISSRSPDIAYDEFKRHRGGFGYIFSLEPKNIAPFSTIKSNMLALIKDFNFYYLPKLFSYRTEMDRQYTERLLRNKSTALILIEPTFMKKWDWVRNLDLKFDLTRGLKLDYSSTTNSYILEPPGQIDKESPTWGEYKSQVWDEIASFGSTNVFNQTFNLNYNVPINKLPLLDWINMTFRYGGTYRWTASPVSVQSVLGNTIENSQTIQLNTSVRLTSLYNKVGYLKKINSSAGQPQRQQKQPQPKTKEPDAQNPDNADTTKTKPKVNYVKIIGEGFIRILMSVRDVNFNLTQNSGTLFPGFIPEPNFLGVNMNKNAPGFGFAFGMQKDLRDIAVENQWITTDPALNIPYVTREARDLNYRANIEPFRDFRIEITGDWTKSFSHEEYFKADTFGIFGSFSAVDRGSFTMSYWMLKTAFQKDEENNISPVFEQFLDNRKEVAFRLAEENPNWNGNIVDSTGFPQGYGPSAPQVLTPAFLAAYADIPVDKVFLSYFPTIPYPNWRLTYNGLNRVNLFKGIIRNANISHAYRSIYSVTSFVTNLDFTETPENPGYPNSFDASGNYIPEYRIDLITISEQFSPLITFDITWMNSMLTRLEMRKSRNLSLSFVNNQLTEVSSQEFIVGFGYRFMDVEFMISSLSGSGKKTRLKSDLNIKVDFSIKSNKTILRRIDEVYNLVSTGQKVFSINTSADYNINQQLTIRFYFDKIINNPYTSNQFKNSTTKGGISLRFTLAQ
jgi:cell surface protein SprA